MNSPEQSPRMIVLVVDDSAPTVAMLADVLESAGASALVALRGDRALSIARQITPDLILLDAVMPGMDGFATCRMLKQDEALAHIPVIFMTGVADGDHVVRGFEAGGVDYLTKPIDPRELLARMRVHLSNARVAQAAQAALDTAGRYLLAVDTRARLLWWTPQAGRLVTEFLAEGLTVGAAMPAAVARLIGGAPGDGGRVELQGKAAAIEVEWVGRLAGGECLLRIQEPAIDDKESLLRDRLSISDREAQVLNWIAQGKSNRDIADILNLSPRTVNKHLERIFKKIGVENRTSAAVVALKLFE